MTVEPQHTKPAGRMSADERRRQIVDAALAEFAVKGLHGTTTEDIARRAGITQPYVFRLFGTKKRLFLAAVERGFDRVQATFQAAAEEVAEEADAEERLRAMGNAYQQLLEDRSLLLAQMQTYAACDDPEVRAVAQRRYGELFTAVETAAGASAEQMHLFFAQGMLLNVAAALDLLGVHEEWAARCLFGSGGPGE
jgi:AcrR family transcriptional regulator